MTRILRWTATLMAGVFVWFVLVAPHDLDRFTPEALLRIPLEGVVGALLLILLPERFRRWVALILGVVLGLYAVVTIMDIGFDMVLYRPFDLVLDWPLLAPAVEFVSMTYGRVAAWAAVALAALAAAGIVAAGVASVRRLAAVAGRRRDLGLRAVALLAVICAVPHLAGVRVYSHAAAGSLVDHARQVQEGLNDRETFEAEAAVDAFRDRPGLLSALRGKDVVLTFVESYGRSALELPDVTATLARGDDRLRAAGYTARSAYLTSPTTGGGSWLAHATLLSGLWVDNQQRYQTLVASDRMTLPRAFGESSWRSVGVNPGITRAWPEGDFFHYDRIYAAADLGYAGPKFGFATMPDQFTLETFQRLERSGQHEPIMATIPLVTSHAPWSAIPDLLDWDELGDGSIYATMPNSDDSPDSIADEDSASVRDDYARSVSYSLESVISYLERYGDDDLVFVFLGDHQPAQMVVGENASRDVPITIVARDPAVIDRISEWNWDEGIAPGASAPVLPMSDFRDRFLSAFSAPAG